VVGACGGTIQRRGAGQDHLPPPTKSLVLELYDLELGTHLPDDTGNLHTICTLFLDPFIDCDLSEIHHPLHDPLSIHQPHFLWSLVFAFTHKPFAVRATCCCYAYCQLTIASLGFQLAAKSEARRYQQAINSTTTKERNISHQGPFFSLT
jgi:hypothetical protein